MSAQPQPMPIAKPVRSSHGKAIYDGPVCTSDAYPHIRPGQYEMRCIEAVTYTDPQFKRRVCRLAFSSPNVAEGTTIYGFLNLGDGHREPGRRWKYYAAWIKANGGQPPQRGRTWTPRVFLDLWFLVEVVDVEHDQDQNPHSEGQIYSVVRNILGVTHA